MPQARVSRDGETIRVPAAEVVTGDVLVLEQGQIVYADARLIAGDGLTVLEHE